MASSFRPLSSIPSSLLKDYLSRQKTPADIIEWKYFDSRFNRNRERGYVWIRDQKVSGFIGLIPFRLWQSDHDLETAWTCDWSVEDPQSAGGMGVLLLRQLQQTYDLLVHVGGNESTQRILSRIATLTVPDAALVLHLPLRLGAVLKMLGRQMASLPFDRWNFLNKVPLRRIRRSPLERLVRVEAGVSKAIAPLLEVLQPGKWHPHYDFEYINWLIGNCPALVSGTCYIPDQPAPGAALLFWRPTELADFWRMAILAQSEAQDQIEVLLTKLIRLVYDQKGLALSVVASRLDADLIQILKARGFLAARKRRPLHILTGKGTGTPVQELSNLSFLDIDYAYRF